MSEPLLTELSGSVLTVTLNRPDKLNSFNEAMHQALAEAIGQAESDAAVRAVLLTGAGKGFCAGQDLGDRNVGADQVLDLGSTIERFYNPLIRRLRALEKPIVCAVNGVAAGRRCQPGTRLRHRPGGALGAVHPGLLPDRAGARIPAAPGSCRGWSARRAPAPWR